MVDTPFAGGFTHVTAANTVSECCVVHGSGGVWGASLGGPAHEVLS
jgi:hypothetical protein